MVIIWDFSLIPFVVIVEATVDEVMILSLKKLKNTIPPNVTEKLQNM